MLKVEIKMRRKCNYLDQLGVLLPPFQADRQLSVEKTLILGVFVAEQEILPAGIKTRTSAARGVGYENLLGNGMQLNLAIFEHLNDFY